ncbi:hydantoinase B/oxoprolinase family protein [Aurantimonas sp. 22II-16-19i]|uniref:hydantoinase B/oxoprolinase family protein n=1 Tax=Aurantimonas sp. 22II-16-19i TaxID=1317114 RepID=UPI0009F7C9FC|nr:hydantoinase B/oxoprolinase family protein [Aurantimonas sp. 22II-16-19i]ORE90478.1 AgaG protein [Aurantimonas sp. 22II-16-19i]
MNDAPQAPEPATLDTIALDPITVEVIGAALSSIVEETGEALVRASYSTNIKERRDCSTALFDRDGRTLCQAEHIPVHLGSFLDFIPMVLALHDAAEMRPGDVFVGNDAYKGGGTHLPDIVLAEPIFIDGDLVAWTVNLAHHSDFVDRAHAHIYQEGLRIPPIRLWRAGELQKDVQDLILLNCQVPRERLSDLRAQMAANRVGVRRFTELCAKHGTGTVLASGKALLDYAERKMRAGIAALPDGSWRFEDVFDTLDFDDPIPLAVTVTITGDEIALDFEAPPQVRSGINMTRTALLATAYYIVKSVVDPTVLPNAGLARPITVRAPQGSLLSCSHPAAVNGRVQTCQRVADLILGALAQAAPKKVSACTNSGCSVATFSGTRTSGPEAGHYWVYLETIGGGGGARPTADGLDGIHVHATNTSNLPVEALEVEYPLILERYELVDGSGGGGTHRGGMGLRRVYRATEDCMVRVDITRILSTSWGLLGGEPGAGGSFAVSPSAAPFERGVGTLRAGEWLEIVTPGGGGYGPPADRAPSAIEADGRNDLIAAE